MANGGIIGPINITSRGKNTQTVKTSTGTITTQPGTRLVDALVVAGGGSGARIAGGGGAGGALLSQSNPVDGNAPYPVTIGAGGAAKTSDNVVGNCGSNSVFGNPVSPQTAIGGGGGGQNCQGSSPSPGNGPGRAGGSGGGGGGRGCAPNAGAGGAGTACQGNAGGAGASPGGGAGGGGGLDP